MKSHWIALVLVLSSGCGDNLPDPAAPGSPDGGVEGADGGDKVPPAVPLAFEKGDTFAYVGDTVVNPALAVDSSGGDLPPIVYSSSDPNIASVDDSGNVTAESAGFATITATMIGGDRSTMSEASYDILVSFEVAAWVGTDDTELTFSQGATGVEMYRSTDPTCDISNVLGCENGQESTLSAGETVVDTAFTTERPGYYTYVTQQGDQHFLPMATGSYRALSDSGVVAWKDRLWKVGGYAAGAGYTSDVWSSYDGQNWILETDTPGFSGRQLLGLAVYDDKLWVVGGTDFSGLLRDVWMSEDGVSWTEVNGQTPFGREGHATFAFGGKLWVLGGFGLDDTDKNDVWSTTDGITWTQETAAAAFSPQGLPKVTELGGKLFLVGGTTADAEHSVWSSTDGVSWTLETDSPGIPTRDHFALATFEDKLWLTGGFSVNAPHWDHYGDVWWSTDGKTWTEVADPGLPGRSNHEMAVFDHRLWIIGGADKYSVLRDAWSTLDGQTWRAETSEAGFETRSSNPVVSFNGRLWVFGGFSGSVLLDDVWSSADGLSWRREEDLPFSGRLVAAAAFDGKLWVTGGFTQDQEYFSEVWSSNDGQTWTLVQSDAAFGQRGFHKMVVAGGKMWVIGGYTRTPTFHQLTDVWWSTDGVTWTEAPTDNECIGRLSAAIVGMGDNLYCIGGFQGGTMMSDVWSSQNGADWTQVTSDGLFGGRKNHGAVAMDGRLFIIGGSNGYSALAYLNDVWSSDDGGLHWTQETAGAAFSPRTSFGAAVLDGTIFLSGGMVLGGQGGSGDVWASPDGASWRRAHRSVISF